MSGDRLLRERVQALLREGQLPRAEPLRRWIARGTGHPCALCGDDVEPADYEIELEFAVEAGGIMTYIFHASCQRLWDAERRRERA